MKRDFIIGALLSLCLVVACKQAETIRGESNLNRAPESAALGDNSNAVAATGQAGDNWAKPKKQEVNSPFPPPTGYVNDYAKVVDEKTKRHLEKMLDDLKQREQVEFAVVTMATTGDEDIYDYSLALARTWGIGAKPRGDGLLLFVAIKDRKWQIQVSRSLESALPDEKAGQFGRLMVEPFRAGKYGEGLTKCVEAIIAHLNARPKDKS
jgi:uncharacterized membrane protein YgcG